MQHKRVDYQVLVQGGTTQKYFPMIESLLLLTYQVKMISSLWQAVKIDQSVNQKILNQYCHIESIIYIIKFTIVNILSQISYQEI